MEALRCVDPARAERGKTEELETRVVVWIDAVLSY